MNYPKEFENLIDSFRRLPGIGYKSAERMAYQVLEMKDEYRERFIESLQGVSSLKKCEICHNLSSSNQCEICADINRDKSIICVVQSIKDVFAIEKSNSYNGLYHVLDGVISVKNGKLPEDLNIDSLLERLADVKEVVVATNPNLDGETTALFIAKLLENKDVKVTRLAYGLPMGGNLEYSDDITIMKSFENRKSF
jgi:recombination protein RecR